MEAEIRSFKGLPVTCGGCRTKMDAITSVAVEGETPRTPHPGDVTLCAYCGVMNVYESTMTLRAARPMEVLQAVRDNPVLLMLITQAEHEKFSRRRSLVDG